RIILTEGPYFSVLSSQFAEEKIKIEEVVVTATRIEEAIEETTSEVVVIKAEDIKKMNIQYCGLPLFAR
ncbi:MAG TPA: hypothetical protein DEP99_06370, partial [Nitrospiraceae bacterium]|nr:hypothetical protein [Nitrospiraceae bacterium]